MSARERDKRVKETAEGLRVNSSHLLFAFICLRSLRRKKNNSDTLCIQFPSLIAKPTCVPFTPFEFIFVAKVFGCGRCGSSMLIVLFFRSHIRYLHVISSMVRDCECEITVGLTFATNIPKYDNRCQ